LCPQLALDFTTDSTTEFTTEFTHNRVSAANICTRSSENYVRQVKQVKQVKKVQEYLERKSVCCQLPLPFRDWPVGDFLGCCGHIVFAEALACINGSGEQ
jgi:hypothetical protein